MTSDSVPARGLAVLVRRTRGLGGSLAAVTVTVREATDGHGRRGVPSRLETAGPGPDRPRPVAA